MTWPGRRAEDVFISTVREERINASTVVSVARVSRLVSG